MKSNLSDAPARSLALSKDFEDYVIIGKDGRNCGGDFCFSYSPADLQTPSNGHFCCQVIIILTSDWFTFGARFVDSLALSAKVLILHQAAEQNVV